MGEIKLIQLWCYRERSIKTVVKPTNQQQQKKTMRKKKCGRVPVFIDEPRTEKKKPKNTQKNRAVLSKCDRGKEDAYVICRLHDYRCSVRSVTVLGGNSEKKKRKRGKWIEGKSQQ
jgi:hypothetical protein